MGTLCTDVYTGLKKRRRVKSMNQERSDTKEFWEDSTGKFVTQLRVWIFKTSAFLEIFGVYLGILCH